MSNFSRSVVKSPVFRCFRHAIFAVIALGISYVGTKAQTIVIHPQFDNAGAFHEGLAPVQVGKLWGFIDREGKVIVRPRFERVLSGSGGRFAVKEKGLWGFVKTDGQIAVQAKYLEVKPFSDGVAAFKLKDKWGYIGPNGVIDTDAKYLFAGQRFDGYSFIKNPSGDFVLATSLGQWGDSSGEDASEFHDGVASLKNSDGKQRLYVLENELNDYGGRAIEFVEIGMFNEGLAPATKDGVLWGFIDRNSRFVIEPSFKKARNFSEGFAPVQIGVAWGFVDKRGRFAIPPQFDNAFPPREGYALFRQGKLRGFLRVEGSSMAVALSARFEDAFAFQEGFAPIQQGGKWGYLSGGKASAVAGRDVVDLSPTGR